jgi:hypothetical protein
LPSAHVPRTTISCRLQRNGTQAGRVHARAPKRPRLASPPRGRETESVEPGIARRKAGHANSRDLARQAADQRHRRNSDILHAQKRSNTRGHVHRRRHQVSARECCFDPSVSRLGRQRRRTHQTAGSRDKTGSCTTSDTGKVGNHTRAGMDAVTAPSEKARSSRLAPGSLCPSAQFAGSRARRWPLSRDVKHRSGSSSPTSVLLAA